MAHPSAYKNFTETDFDAIKTSLKNHLQSQDVFKDFDFEGSAINVLLNVLAYNTQYNAYYLNMLASEKFISHAQKRESVVGLANNIGYVPRSSISATAVFSFTVTPDDGYTDPITIPAETTFTSTIDGVTYDFLTTSPHVATINGDGKYVFTDVEVKQGRKFTHKYLVDATTKFFQLPNTGIDTSRITVTVKPSVLAATGTVFALYDNFALLDDTSEVFFIQETFNQLYEVYFGDGVIGVAPQPGNQIVVDYYVCAGTAPNGARVFVLDDEVTGISTVQFDEVTAAFGGADIESIDSVRLSAPSNYSTQNRAVNTSDYYTIVKRISPDVVYVNIWGGEEMIPAQYGKVFISVMGEGGETISQTEKDLIKTTLKKYYTIMSIFPEIVDPQKLYIKLNLEVKYNSATMHSSVSQIQADVLAYIDDFETDELSDFDVQFRQSKFLTGVDASSVDIISSGLTKTVYYNISDFIGSSTITYNQAIVEGSITSTEFTYLDFVNCKFADAGGSLNIVRYNTDTNQTDTVQLGVGTINYTTGLITYNEPDSSFYSIYVATDADIRIYVEVEDVDIVAKNNTVLLIDPADITLEMVNVV